MWAFAEAPGVPTEQRDIARRTLDHQLETVGRAARAGVIDELIRIKGADRARGAAFRPGREAQMMQVLAERHRGSVPLSMIVHVWREIISTFTFMQAPYRLHLAEGEKPAAMRDAARYHFGFTVEIVAHDDAPSAMAAAGDEPNALAVVPLSGAGAWWNALDATNGISVMARLPVTDVPFDSSDAFVLSPPLSDPVPFDLRLYTGIVERPGALDGWRGGHVIAAGKGDDRTLIAIPSGGSAPPGLLDIRAAGGYFAPASCTDENR